MASHPNDMSGDERYREAPPVMRPGHPMDGPPSWQNGGRKTPDNIPPGRTPRSSPGPKTPGMDRDRDRSLPDRSRDPDGRRSGERTRSRQRSGRSASGQQRACKKCGEPLTGQFVRALDGTFHLDCFKCRVRTAPSPFS
jgi:hypothetical protein